MINVPHYKGVKVTDDSKTVVCESDTAEVMFKMPASNVEFETILEVGNLSASYASSDGSVKIAVNGVEVSGTAIVGFDDEVVVTVTPNAKKIVEKVVLTDTTTSAETEMPLAADNVYTFKIPVGGHDYMVNVSFADSPAKAAAKNAGTKYDYELSQENEGVTLKDFVIEEGENTITITLPEGVKIVKLQYEPKAADGEAVEEKSEEPVVLTAEKNEDGKYVFELTREVAEGQPITIVVDNDNP